jgi:hypothetical protein
VPNCPFLDGGKGAGCGRDSYSDRVSRIADVIRRVVAVERFGEEVGRLLNAFEDGRNRRERTADGLLPGRTVSPSLNVHSARGAGCGHGSGRSFRQKRGFSRK